MTGRILVVEDETITARRIQAMLKGLGYVVTRTVASGVEAVEAVASQAPDLVLMDIHLEGHFDGIDAAEHIRERYGTPVVYITSSSDERTISRAKKTGAYGYVLKPFDDRDLKTAIDIAIHKREIEERAAQRERWFAIVLKSIGDGVIATDAEHRITFMNAVAERLSGWSSAEGKEHKLGEVLQLVEDVSTPALDPTAPRRESPPDLSRNAALQTRSGARLGVDGSGAPIVDDKGNVVGHVVVFRDVTERRELEHRLARVERLAALGTLSAGIAHEINNPLTYVLGNVDFALEELPEAGVVRAVGGGDAEHLASKVGEIKAALREAREGGQRVQRIVGGLQKFGRSDVVVRSVLDLSEVIDAAVRMTANVLRHHAEVRREYQPIPRVEGNEGQLVQVFVNLLLNAAQAIGDGLAETQVVVVATYKDDAGRAVAEVRDSGPGIRPEILHRIFDPFFTTKPVGEGWGLGLSISHAVVQAHGGEIAVTSELGKGTSFRVSLRPAREPEPADQPEATSVEAVTKPPAACRGRILVIDDEPAIGRLMHRILSREHDVLVVADPRGALSRLATGECFDVVFCDLMMPGMTGMDFVEAVRASKPELVSRIVLMTGGAFTARAESFLQTMTNGVLMKPVDANEVRRIVRDRLAADS